jgi:predicted Zn-dependent protease
MRKLGAVLLLSLAACDSPTIPPASIADIYDFRLMTTPPQVLRWPSGTRVRVYVAGAPGEREDIMASAFTNAAAQWNRHALYGEYELVQAADVTAADVVLRWSDESSPVDLSECLPSVSIAVTTFCLDDTDPTRLLTFPLAPPNAAAASNVHFVITILGSQVTSEATVRKLVTHEMGHALGIARHSTNPMDFMAAGIPADSTLRLRDIATVQILYHTRPQVTP